jgi:hypothetical protein
LSWLGIRALYEAEAISSHTQENKSRTITKLQLNGQQRERIQKANNRHW